MKKFYKKDLILGLSLLFVFIVLLVLLLNVDIKQLGARETNIGLSTINVWFNNLFVFNKLLYTITDWLGILPFLVCAFFGVVGLLQLIKRKSLLKVDTDIISLGIYYIIIIALYFIFQFVIINYRPILIEGVLEASFPSSTVLLVLSVMPTLIFQSNRRLKRKIVKTIISIFDVLFSVFMLLGRLVSGVHWLTDILASVFLGLGLFFIYKTVVRLTEKD